jgi:hypothetical protein
MSFQPNSLHRDSARSQLREILVGIVGDSAGELQTSSGCMRAYPAHPSQIASALLLAPRLPLSSSAAPEANNRALLLRSLEVPNPPVPAGRILDAIAKEKARILHDLSHLLSLASPATLRNILTSPSTPTALLSHASSSTPFARPPDPSPSPAPSVRVVAEAIGSQIRKGKPYVDVTILPGREDEDAFASRNRGGVAEIFPESLHRMLKDTEDDGHAGVVSFLSHGRAFIAHDVDAFVEKILPKYFKLSKWSSFLRQLNLYGFVRVTSGPDAGAYFHELFLRGHPYQSLCLYMRRVGVPQQHMDRRKKKCKLLERVPDFYAMKKLE